MKITRRARCGVSWIALIAFLFATLAPTVSAAFPHRSSAPAIWGQLCTVDGPARVQLNDDASDDQPTTTHHSAAGHCLLCFSPATPGPDQLPAVAGFTRAVTLLPRLFLRTPRPLFIWASAQPRGPPLPA